MGERVVVPLGDREPDAVPTCEGDGLWRWLALADCEVDCDSLGVAERLGVIDEDGEDVGECVGSGEGEGDCERVSRLEPVRVPVAVPLGVPVVACEREADSLGDPERVGDLVWLRLRLPVRVPVPVGLGEPLCDPDAACDAEAVCVGACEPELVRVADTLGVPEALMV